MCKLLILHRDSVMWAFIPADTSIALEPGALVSWNEMEISIIKMELILRNLKIINW